ncbi:MAG TPA: CarD family transcriptional regulator [Acidobacteriota bacterium]|nr:CarD family transcriptional regulator [Acidobacteriota bacterium]
MEFNVGDKVIYPNQGVGVIQDVCQRSIAGRQEQFYLLKIPANNSTVMIPVANVNHVGLRRLCSDAQLDGLFEVLRGEFSTPNPDWKNRYKDNLEKMRTGSIFEVAEVLKNLYFLSYQKSLSFREKKMFDRARQLIVSEIATVKGEDVGQVESQVDTILADAYRRSVGRSA